VLELDTVFGRSAPVVLDIGIGLGDTTLAMAAAQPELDVIGVDVHTPGIASSLAGIEEHGLSNLRLVHGDALEFLDRLAPSSLTGVRVFFPDPWPKARHHHRRIVRADVVARLVARLRPAGWIHLATDNAEYAAVMQRVCDDHPELRGGPLERPPERPLTRYEEKGLAAGRTVTDLRYVRLADGPKCGSGRGDGN
jgi:tRNA (guanine-N7-)-methyltransferase